MGEAVGCDREGWLSKKNSDAEGGHLAFPLSSWSMLTLPTAVIHLWIPEQDTYLVSGRELDRKQDDLLNS